MRYHRGPYSFSRISDYEFCPHRFRLVHMEKRDQIRTPSAQRSLDLGSLGHVFAEQYLAHLGATREAQNIDQAAKIANWVFSDRPTCSLTESDRSPFVSLAMRFARTVEWRPEGDVFLELALAVDENLELVEPDSPDRLLSGRLDALEIHGSEATITDWKFGWAKETESFFQLLIYAFFVSLFAPQVKRFLLRCHHVRHNQPDETRIQKPLRRVRRRLLEAMDRIERDEEFVAQPSTNACAMCPVAYCCEARPSELVTIQSDEDAQQIATDIVMLDNIRAQKMAALRPYCEQAGSVIVPGGEFAIHPTEKVDFDTSSRAEAPRTIECPSCEFEIEVGPPERMIDQVLRLGGHDPERLYNLNGRRARELLSGDSPAARLLEKLAERKMGTRFQMRKPKKS